MESLPSSFDPDVIYRVERGDGVIAVGKVTPYYDANGTLEDVTLYTNNRAHDITPLAVAAVRGGGAIFSRPGGPTFTLTPLTLDTPQEVWPKAQKTFPTLDDVVAFAEKAISEADSYTPNVAADETLAFTSDEDGNVLELTMESADGDLFYRNGGRWVQVDADGDYPGVYGRSLIEVDPDDEQRALRFWDESSGGDAIKKEQILPFARMYQ